MNTAILTFALLVAPVALLVGVGAGAWLTYRLLRGQSPIPTFQRAQVVQDKPAAPTRQYPKIQA